MQLGQLEEVSFYDGSGVDVNFNVVDDANDIARVLDQQGSNSLNNAEDVQVVGGVVSVDSAAAIQNVAAYDSGASSYVISDTAGAILNANSTVLADNGVSEVNVDGVVEADIGADLGALESSLNQPQQPIFKSLSREIIFEREPIKTEPLSDVDINFNVVDDANDIAGVLYQEGSRSLDNAEDVQVVGGVVSVDSAAAIQNVAAYDSGASSYAISDTAGAILDATATVIDDGVSTINVESAVEAGVGVS